MSTDAAATRAVLDAWRERGADRFDRVRFCFIEALARRAAAVQEGAARTLLDSKVSKLLAAYADDLDRAGTHTTVTVTVADGFTASARCEPAASALAQLLDYVASRTTSTYPTLDALEYFRTLWSELSAGTQLRWSLEQVPDNAGPLHSSSLVHRSLALMHELSPRYLQCFLSYVDALSWMDEMSGAMGTPSKDTPRTGGARKQTRSKTR